MEHGRNLTVWFDRNLAGGQVWDDEIRRAINRSDIFVCLVTANFLASNYIRDTELPAILQAADGRGALLIPVILETSFWKDTFGTRQCVPHDAKGNLKPVADWRPKHKGLHTAADETARAIDEWLKKLPPPPADPGPGASLLVTPDGFDLAPDVPGPGERDDPLQKRLLDGLRRVFDELRDDAQRCRNSHRTLCRTLDGYGELIRADLADLDVAALVTAGSALGGLVEALRPPLPAGVMTEPLEPELTAGFETLLREHARLVMGFAEGREIIARDGQIRALIDDAPAARRTLHDVLRPMSEERGLLTEQARDLTRMVDESLIEVGVKSTEAVASAVRYGGRTVGAIARAVAGKFPRLTGTVTKATFADILAGDPNLTTYGVAFRFLDNYATQISAFAANQPEIRRLLDWTMEQMSRRELPAIAPEPTEQKREKGRQTDGWPPDFDPDVVQAMVLRGEAPPESWVPRIRELDLSGTRLSDLTPVGGLTNLTKLDCSGTQVADLTPIAALTSLRILNCSDTLVADLAPIAILTSLRMLNCSRTPIADLTPIAALSSLTTLYCWGTQVADLSPIAALTNLTTLNCRGTQVADLAPITALTNLTRLSCSDTPVADLSPIAALTNLISLDCWGTQVADLAPITALTNLTSLSCWGTQVADLAPIAALTSLTSLDCSRTQVADLAPITALTNLTSLSCWGTQVADLAPIAALTSLTSLDCSRTQVADLAPIGALGSLECLFLADLIAERLDLSCLHGRRIRELVLLGSPGAGSVPRLAEYQIDPDGTVHGPDHGASFEFGRYAQIARERAEQGRSRRA